jgi:Cu(I)/Ag(I) efflux system protein CusF
MKRQLYKITSTVAVAVFALSAYAQQGGKGMDMGNMKMDCSKHMGDMKGMKDMDCMGKDASKTASLTDGEVKSVDAAAGQVTLQHGAIKNMKMPPMTMAFPVQDKSLLSSLKEGSKVKFSVQNVEGVATITSLIPQK